METPINSSLKSVALTVARPVSYNIHTSFIFPRFYPPPSRWGDKWSWSHSSQCAQPWIWWRHLWDHHCSVLEPRDQLRQGHPGLDVYPDISGSQEKPKNSIVFRSTRVLSCTLRLVACGFEVSHCPTDNQPLGATIDTRQCQSLDLDGKQSQVQVPPTTAGQKVPMVIDLHGKNS